MEFSLYLNSSRTTELPTVCVPTILPVQICVELPTVYVPTAVPIQICAHCTETSVSQNCLPWRVVGVRGCRREGLFIWLTVPAHKVTSRCIRTFVSHSDRSLGSGNWRSRDKKSFGCWFILLPGEAGALPPCSSLPLLAPLLPWVSEELALNTTFPPLTSSANEQAALLPDLPERGSSTSAAPASSRTGRETAANSTHGQKGERKVSREGFTTWSGTEGHTVPLQTPQRGTKHYRKLWGFLPTQLFHPFSPPEIMEGPCLPETGSEAEISKIQTPEEPFGKNLCGGKLQG